MTAHRTRARSCPGRGQLERLLADQLGAADRAAVEAHVEGCASCQAALGRLTEGTDTARWRRLRANRFGGPRLTPAAEILPRAEAGDERPTVAGYELLEELGRGGMGVVYKARQVRLNRTVALKMILAGHYAGPEQLTRFYVEAETVARLRHPNIVEIFEVGEARGQPYMVIEYVAGTSLAAQLSGTPLPGRQAAGLIEALARAMQVAHAAGIVHRDLKPSNVLVTADGTPKITDFGLAKRLDRDPAAAPARPATESGTILGTPGYMAPEQAAGKGAAVGPPADIYALGALLYELVTGRPPFTGETPLDTLVQVMHVDPVPPSRLQPKLPRDLETICLKCLQKEPRKRYASALDLAEDLRRFQAGEPTLARPTPAWERVRKWARRQPTVAALTAVSVGLAALGLGLVTWQWQRAEDKAAAEAQSRREVERLNARLALDHGLRLCEQGHLRRGLLWMLRGRNIAVKVSADDLERAIGLNLTCWCRQLSRLQCSPGASCPIRAVAFSPDSRVFLTAGQDGLAHLWHTRRAETPAVLHIPPELILAMPFGAPLHHPGGIHAAAFSPDGRHVVTAGADGTARLWELATRLQQGTPLRHAAAVRAVAYSPDGRTILTGSEDGTARLWAAPRADCGLRIADCGLKTSSQSAICNPQSAIPLGPPVRIGGRVLALAFSPDGRSFATGSEDGQAQLWDTATGQPRATFPRHPGPVRAIAFSPYGNTLLTRGSDGVVRIWEVGAPLLGHRLQTMPQREVRLVRALRHYGRAVRAAAFGPSGRTVLTGTTYGEAQLWEVATGKPVGEPLWGQRGPIRAIAFSPDGKIFVTGGADVLQLWCAPSEPARGAPLRHGCAVQAVAFSPDGKFLATGGRDGSVRLWDGATGKQTGAPLTHAQTVFGVAFSPDGRRLATAGKDGAVRLWEPATGRPVGEPLRHPGAVFALAFSPDGNLLVTSCQGEQAKTGEVRLWEAATGQPRGQPFVHSKRIYTVGFRPDGAAFMTGGDDNMVQFWEVATGKPAGPPPLEHQGRVAAVAFSPDGKTILTGSYDKTARLWDAATGLPIGQPLAHRKRVEAVAFAPDGKTAVTGCYDGTAQLWDVATGVPLGPPLTHRGPVRGVCFHPDGRRVATASADGTAQFWGAVIPPAKGQPWTDLWREASALTEYDFSGLGRELDSREGE